MVRCRMQDDSPYVRPLGVMDAILRRVVSRFLEAARNVQVAPMPMAECKHCRGEGVHVNEALKVKSLCARCLGTGTEPDSYEALKKSAKELSDQYEADWQALDKAKKQWGPGKSNPSFGRTKGKALQELRIRSTARQDQLKEESKRWDLALDLALAAGAAATRAKALVERVPFAASLVERAAAPKRLASDQEDLAELKDTMQALVQSGTHSSFSFTYRKIEGRSALSLARIKALVKKYPKVIAGWFGGTDLDYTEGSMGGGSVLDEPFKQPRVRRPQRYSPASFTVIRRASLVERVAARYWTAMRRPTKLKDLPTSRLSGRPEVVLAPDLKPGMRLAYHKWMARTRLTRFPNRWFDMVVEAVDIQGGSVVVMWSGKFINHENADFYDPREPISVGKDQNRLRLDSKVNVLL